MVARGEQTVQQTQRVTHRAAAEPCDAGDDLVVGADPLGLENLSELAADLLRGERAEVEPLAPALDGRRNLRRHGRAQYENHVGGRLLHRLEQGVEGVRGNLVHFVDDVDLVSAPSRGEHGGGNEIPYLVDAAMRGTIDLDDVQVCAAENRLGDLVGLLKIVGDVDGPG